MKVEKIKITPQWTRSKDEIWAEMFDRIEDTQNKRIIPRIIPLYRRKVFTYSVAAVVTVMLVLSSAMFLYTTEVYTERGEHLSALLPDGSKVELNAESNLSYKPYWWSISREVKMTGEAYFEVEKGSKFAVTGTQGSVTVLGTTFNVLDRNKQYSVTCLTGKVSVQIDRQSVILNPGMQSVFENGNLTDNSIEIPSKVIDWRFGKFWFVSTPLKEVIAEVERQYNIIIKTPANSDFIYSGNFSKYENPEQVLRIIEKPFGIKLTIEK